MAVSPTPTHDCATEKPPRRRRRMPLSLRIFAAILVVLLVGSVLSVWVPYYREQLVIQMIERRGGGVDTEICAPNWLRQLVSDDPIRKCEIFERVFSVDLDETRITDAEIAQLSRMTNLSTLSLGSTPVTDAGLTHLYGLRKLNILYLGRTAVTDRGARDLKKALPNCSIRR